VAPVDASVTQFGLFYTFYAKNTPLRCLAFAARVPVLGMVFAELGYAHT